MKSTKPFLTVGNKTESEEVCLICKKSIGRKEKRQTLGDAGWARFKEDAKKWATINIPVHNSKHRFTEISTLVKGADSTFGKVHKSCRIDFSNKADRYIQMFGTVEDVNLSQDEAYDDIKPQPQARRPRNQSLVKRHCFICDEDRIIDNRLYNEGGLGRCSTESACRNLIERKSLYEKDPTHRFFNAAQRLNILMSGASRDIFAIDIFYHQSCYLKLTLSKIRPENYDNNQELEQELLQSFFHKLRATIKSAFLLNELLEDIKIMSEEEGLPRSPIMHTSTLKGKIIDECKDKVSFFPTGKYLLVHPSDVNPREYPIAALHGCGLRDNDLAKSFGRMIRRKLPESTETKRE